MKLISRVALASLFLAPSAAAQGLPPVPVPPGNPITPAKVLLGKVLFWEEQLSSTRTVACATCHLPAAGGSDPRSGVLGVHPGLDGTLGTPDDVAGSPGVIRNEANGEYTKDGLFGLQPQITGRKAPSTINSVYSPVLFWDGRAANAFTDPQSGIVVLPNRAALESQAAGPLLSDVEMAHAGRDWADVEARLQGARPLALAEDVPLALADWIGGRAYPQLFQEAFGSADITAARVLMSIATYERTLISDQTRFDDFLAGVPQALTPPQARGLGVFNGPANCRLCHAGPLLTDNQFHNIGVRPNEEDAGRAAITGNPADTGRFKTPGLRNVALRAPLFHNGSMRTVADVVDFYIRGGDFHENQDPLIQPLNLSPGQRNDLIAFLTGGLIDPRVQAETAPFDRPTLYTESSRRPQPLGQPTPGTGGFLPAMVAVEPALLGSSMALGMDGGLGGALALLAFDTVTDPAGSAFKGATIYLGFSPGLRLVTSMRLRGAGGGEGWSSISLPVPSDGALAGLGGAFQWAVIDAGSLAATAAASVTLF